MTSLPQIKYYHKQIVIYMVYFVAMMLNAFPSAQGISETLSPCTIVTRGLLDVKKDCRCQFGDYIEPSIDAVITNDMKSRTQTCIAVGPSGNLQGSVTCFDLETGKVVIRRTINEVIPMPTRVIKSINQWGQKGQKVEQYGNKLEFLNQTKKKFDWNNEEINETEGLVEELEDNRGPYPDIPAEIPGMVLESDLDELDEAAVQEPPSHDYRLH